jgi:hypothetical protein
MEDKKLGKKSKAKYTIREIGANLHGYGAEVTAYSDVNSEPFPFSEEDNSFLEQQEFIITNRNEP